MSEEYKEKLRSIQFSPAAKNPGARKNYFDSDSLRDQHLIPETGSVEELTEGVGPLRWSSGTPYKRSRSTGDYEKATPKDVDIFTGGTGGGKERRSSRSFALGS